MRQVGYLPELMSAFNYVEIIFVLILWCIKYKSEAHN